ncbi:hypothetical protein K504DRAFT_344431, partial [Pleomassaria siparia CBS 279.74]
MAFRQHHRPQPSRLLSFQTPEPAVEARAISSPQRKRPLEESEEWVLFSPAAPSTTARTHTTSTERTPRTAGLSHLSDFGSLETVARPDHDDDDIACHGTEDGEELDSLDEGLHAFHEPSEYGVPASRLQQSGDTVLPTHDGLGTFQPDGNMQENMWHFERQVPRRRHARRRSSVQRRLDALDEAEELNQEQNRRQRIEKWRLEQSKALLEEIERETRRRRRMSVVSATRSRKDSAHQEEQRTLPWPARSASDGQSETSEESPENMSFWQRLTRRVIRDLMGIDDDTLSVIFGEALPEEATSTPNRDPVTGPSIDNTLQALDMASFPGEPWEHRLLERVAHELGILVHQLSGHPGAFSTYRRTQEVPEYAGLAMPVSASNTNLPAAPLTASQPTISSPAFAQFAPSFPAQQSSNIYSEASLWGIEEERENDPLESFRSPQAAAINTAEELAHEREYWERELDIKMVFNFLTRRFSSRRPSTSSQTRRSLSAPGVNDETLSARRAAIIRQHHPLVNQSTDRVMASSSSKVRETSKKEAAVYRTRFNPQPSLRSQVLRSSSSCASQSTKKSKKSNNSNRNYWDLGGSVGS